MITKYDIAEVIDSLRTENTVSLIEAGARLDNLKRSGTGVTTVERVDKVLGVDTNNIISVSYQTDDKRYIIGYNSANRGIFTVVDRTAGPVAINRVLSEEEQIIITTIIEYVLEAYGCWKWFVNVNNNITEVIDNGD